MSRTTLPARDSGRSRTLPRRLAWVGRARPAAEGVADHVQWFGDSDDFLLAPDAFGFDFYVLHLAQQGVSGLDLVRLVRKRTAAGVLALDDAAAGSVAPALDSGADMVLAADVPLDDIRAAIAAVHRRAQATAAPSAAAPWTLHEDRSTLRAPDGVEIGLSASDLALLQCFAEAPEGKVERAVLVERLWGPEAGSMDNALHATVYRLRKRIEQSGHAFVPLHALAKVGYEFRAPLVKA
ncbi:MAG TPA: winged helix-turn-helix domain-containing protein [Rhizobacter sp.]